MDADRIITLEEIEYFGRQISTKYNCIFNISTNFTFVNNEIHRRYIVYANRRFAILDGVESTFTDDKQLLACLIKILDNSNKLM